MDEKEREIVDKNRKIGQWFWGESRTGKSTKARQENPYIKMVNKWWDGYAGEEEVLLEDVDKSHSPWLGSFLKIWSDHWEFRAEVKGDSIIIQPFRTFYVTSNYHPEELFDD